MLEMFKKLIDKKEYKMMMARVEDCQRTTNLYLRKFKTTCGIFQRVTGWICYTYSMN